MADVAIKKAAPIMAVLVLEGLDVNAVLFECMINGFSKIYCMCPITMQAKRIGSNEYFISRKGCYLPVLYHC